jgi:hypothetical protein
MNLGEVRGCIGSGGLGVVWRYPEAMRIEAKLGVRGNSGCNAYSVGVLDG